MGPYDGSSIATRGWGMKKAFVCAGALALSLGLPAAVAQAQGLEDLHSKVRVGGRLCMADHFHDGSGSGPTRAAATNSAIRAWIDFTAWEYGRRWGSWGASVSKRVSCSGSSGNYSCSVYSRPCRG
jgi:hypothetical protein